MGITQTSSGWKNDSTGKTYSNLSSALSDAGAAGYGSNPSQPSKSYGSSTTQWTNPNLGSWSGYSNSYGIPTNSSGSTVNPANNQVISQTPVTSVADYVKAYNQAQQPTPQVPQYQMPTMPNIPQFTPPAQNTMNFDQAKTQVQQQLDPLYQKALQNIQQQKYQNQLNSDQIATGRGLGHSGLAADLQNKVNIQAAQDRTNADLDKQSKIAAMAQALQQQDYNNYQNTYSNALNTWLNNSNMAINQYKLGSQLAQWQQEEKDRQAQQEVANKLALYGLVNRIF